MNASTLVQKLWKCCNALHDHGMSYGDYAELAARGKTGLDIFGLTDETLAENDNLPLPDVIAQEIVDNLEAALEPFRWAAAE